MLIISIVAHWHSFVKTANYKLMIVLENARAVRKLRRKSGFVILDT